jgi:glyoxylase-like metal-dependent hydrolase (beta-lactamase superfamily II)
MNRRRFLVSSSAAAIAAAWRERRVYAQAPGAKPATKFEELRGGTGIFTGRGGTIGWLVTDEGAVVVDSQFPGTAEACVEGIKRRSRRGIHVLINTHHHGDHTSGNKIFRPSTKFIVAHANSAEWQQRTAAEEKSEAAQAYPDQTFTNVWQLKIGGEHVVATYYGFGHTSGDVAVAFEAANVVHMGDLVFNRFHPFIDRPAGASIANWITALERAAREHSADTTYIFGHGQDRFGVTGKRARLDALSRLPHRAARLHAQADRRRQVEGRDCEDAGAARFRRVRGSRPARRHARNGVDDGLRRAR